MRSTKKNLGKERKGQTPLIPIVDQVVEMVFVRLKDAAARAKASTKKKAKQRSKDAAARTDVTENHDGLAGAVADLLLAALTHPPKRAAKRVRARAGPRRTV